MELSEEQIQAIEQIEDKSRTVTFLTGRAGTGKSLRAERRLYVGPIY